MIEHTFTLTDAQRDEVIDVGREELRQAERSVREILHETAEEDLDEGDAEELADSRERAELWAGILTALGDDA